MKTMPLRIRVKAIITTLALILFPVYYYYLSPVIPLMGSTQGIVTGSILVFILLFVISMFLGRGFCAYVCPAGKIQDMTNIGSNRKFPRTAFSWLKYIVWASWLGTLFFLFRRAGGFKGFQFAFQTQMGISVTDIGSLLTYLMVLLVFFLMALLFGRRAACHTLCWMAPFMVLGKKIGKMLHIPSLTIMVSSTSSCVSCGRCDDVCPMSLEISKMVKQGSIESVDCILCGNCVNTCGRHALIYAWRH